MTVEFFGLPGSGKSSIANYLFRTWDKSVCPINYPLHTLYTKPWFTRNIKKLLFVLRFAISNSRKAFSFVQSFSQIEQRSTFRFISLLINQLFFIDMQKKHGEYPGVVLFDEGVLHQTWSIFLEAKPSAEKKNMLQFYQYPDVVVLLDANSHNIDTALRERGSNPRHQRALSDAALQRERMIKAIDDLPSSVMIVRYDNSDFSKTDEMVKSLREKIAEIYMSEEKQDG